MSASHRGKRLFFLLAAAMLFLPFLVSCSEEEPRRAVFTDVFDTVTEFAAYGVSEEVFQTASDAVHEELLRIHKLCDIYHLYDGVTNLCFVNERLGGDRYELDPDLIRILDMGKAFYGKTGGKCNIGMGSVLSLWHEAMEQGECLPDKEALQNALFHIDLDTLLIENDTVVLTDPKLLLDLGAFAKGFAAERACDVAKAHGLSSFSLNLGGNILLRGEKPQGAWTVGVQDPDGGIYTVLRPGERSAVTSGDYQRYMEIDGVRYHHIIDPETGYPASLYRSVTVLCEDSFAADALSTSLFCLPKEEGERLAKEYGAEALWITKDGEAFRTEGFSQYETKR